MLRSLKTKKSQPSAAPTGLIDYDNRTPGVNAAGNTNVGVSREATG